MGLEQALPSQLSFPLRCAGSMPWALTILPTQAFEIKWPRSASAPWLQSPLQPGFPVPGARHKFDNFNRCASTADLLATPAVIPLWCR
jgi:hypothetical protein